MTELIVYSASDPNEVYLNTRNFAVIERHIAAVGAHVERWGATHALNDGASAEEILSAYAPEIERLNRSWPIRASRGDHRLEKARADAARSALRREGLGGLSDGNFGRWLIR